MQCNQTSPPSLDFLNRLFSMVWILFIHSYHKRSLYCECVPVIRWWIVKKSPKSSVYSAFVLAVDLAIISRRFLLKKTLTLSEFNIHYNLSIHNPTKFLSILYRWLTCSRRWCGFLGGHAKWQEMSGDRKKCCLLCCVYMYTFLW